MDRVPKRSGVCHRDHLEERMLIHGGEKRSFAHLAEGHSKEVPMVVVCGMVRSSAAASAANVLLNTSDVDSSSAQARMLGILEPWPACPWP